MDVVVIGGGIAGLATAYFLQKQAHQENRAVRYQLIESSPSFGGKIASEHSASFVVEGGPDSFITQKTSAIELCRELGLGDQLIGTNDVARQVYVWSGGRLQPMPAGVSLMVPTQIRPFLSSPLISWPGKLRMGLEAIIPPRGDDGDESLSHFVRRRLGAEALDKIAEPMIAGIYVADAESLSLQSTFPRFLDMERKYGSLLRGIRAQRKAGQSGGANGKAAPSMFMTLRDGLQCLVDALVARLEPNALLLGRKVTALTPEGNRYAIRLNDSTALQADAVVLATPAYVSAGLLEAMDPDLSRQLGAIRYVSTATVSLGFRRAEIDHPLRGFGFVVPRSEQRKIVACTWLSTKFNHRAPEGHALLRAFVGGARAEHLAEQDDSALIHMVRDELRAAMGITATPVLARVFHWPKANPQYEVGHLERIAAIEQRAGQHRGIYLVGSAYHGVGIPDCIQDGARAAAKILTREDL